MCQHGFWSFDVEVPKESAGAHVLRISWHHEYKKTRLLTLKQLPTMAETAMPSLFDTWYLCAGNITASSYQCTFSVNIFSTQENKSTKSRFTWSQRNITFALWRDTPHLICEMICWNSLKYHKRWLLVNELTNSVAGWMKSSCAHKWGQNTLLRSFPHINRIQSWN